MKKSILLFAFVTFSLFSCSKDDGNTEDNASIETSELVATWNLQQALLNGSSVSSSYKIQFTSTKKAKFYYKNPTSNTTFGPDIIDNGNYSLNGNSFTITWDDSDPGNETDTFQILELTSTKLKLKSTDDEGTLIETYTK